MRVTQNSLFDAFRFNLSLNTRRLLDAQEQIATQKRINRVSDDPLEAPRLIDVKGLQSRTNQFLRNITRAESNVDLQDTVLGQAEDLIFRVKDLLLGQANEITSTPETREAARLEITTIINQFIQLGNTKFDGQFIFSGYNVSTPAFDTNQIASASGVGNTGGASVASAIVLDEAQVDPTKNYQIVFTGPGTFDVVDQTGPTTIVTGGTYTSGDPISFAGIEVTVTDGTGTPLAGDTFDITLTAPGAYQGDNGRQRIEIQNGTLLEQNLLGSEVFKGAGGGTDVFDVLNRINAALRTNDRAEIDNLLDETDSARVQFSSVRSIIGSRQNLLSGVRERQSNIQFELESLRSGIEDIDFAEAISRLEHEQTAYEASLASSARILNVSLLDFLR